MASWFACVLVFFFSLGLLFFSRYCLTQSCGKLLRHLNVSEAVVIFICAIIGFTVVEAFLAVSSVIYGEKSIALGVFLGAVIANIGLVMGLSSLFKSFPVEDDLFRRETPAMFIALLVLYFLGRDLVLSRIDGLVLILLSAFFFFLNFKDDRFTGIDETAARPDKLAERVNRRWAIGIAVAALVGLAAGAYLLFRSAPEIADFLNLRKWPAALLVFGPLYAVGRVFLSWVNPRKDFTGVASLLTSNTCNILFAIGLIALIEPVYLSPSVIKFEIPAIALFSAAILAVVRLGKRVNRQQGILMLSGYLIFVLIILFHFN
jgi:cation:H+ antiporter